MKRNVGYTGRIIRIILGVAFVLMYFNSDISRPWNVVALVAGIVLLLTGLTGFSPLNQIMGINTSQRQLREPKDPY